jgi:metal-responsive CopG/Arc/MetJ family transcriptional regulator
MLSITIRLDENLEKLLEQELQAGKKSRSDLVRDALQEYLSRHKRERLVQAMVREMKSLSAEARQEGLDIAGEFLPAQNEALELSEAPKPHGTSAGEKENRWWK